MDRLWPIWKDYFVEFDTAEDVMSYRIECNNVEIYNGIAHRRPGQTSFKIKINDICADYLANRFPGISEQGASQSVSAPTFSVYDAEETQVASVQLINDWSYEFSHDTSIASAPIDGIVDPRQPIIYSTYADGSVTAELTFADDTTMNVVIALARSADFNDDFNDDFATTVGGSSAGSIMIKPSEWEGLSSIAIGSTVYRVQNTCQRYALYYANAYGGWDTFVPRNIATREDTFDRHDHLREYDNSVQMERGLFNYLTEVKPSWKLSTHYLSDEESQRMHHLIGTNAAYLYDMETGDLWPVNVTNKSVSYLTAKNNGRKFPTYTIELSLARTRIRR